MILFSQKIAYNLLLNNQEDTLFNVETKPAKISYFIINAQVSNIYLKQILFYHI